LSGGAFARIATGAGWNSFLCVVLFVAGGGAIAFVNMLLGPVGTAAFNVNGPTPIAPALVSAGDYERLPKPLQPLITAGAVPP